MAGLPCRDARALAGAAARRPARLRLVDAGGGRGPGLPDRLRGQWGFRPPGGERHDAGAACSPLLSGWSDGDPRRAPVRPGARQWRPAGREGPLAGGAGDRPRGRIQAGATAGRPERLRDAPSPEPRPRRPRPAARRHGPARRLPARRDGGAGDLSSRSVGVPCGQHHGPKMVARRRVDHLHDGELLRRAWRRGGPVESPGGRKRDHPSHRRSGQRRSRRLHPRRGGARVPERPSRKPGPLPE